MDSAFALDLLTVVFALAERARGSDPVRWLDALVLKSQQMEGVGGSCLSIEALPGTSDAPRTPWKEEPAPTF